MIVLSTLKHIKTKCAWQDEWKPFIWIYWHLHPQKRIWKLWKNSTSAFYVAVVEEFVKKSDDWISHTVNRPNSFFATTRVRYWAGSRDDMGWNPYIRGLWLARMPADHTWRTITGANEMKWNETNDMNVEIGGMKFVAGENGRDPEENLPTDSVSSSTK